MQVIEGQTPSTGSGINPTMATESKKGDERPEVSRVPSQTMPSMSETRSSWFQRALAKIELQKTGSDNFNQSFTNYVSSALGINHKLDLASRQFFMPEISLTQGCRRTFFQYL